MNESNKGPVSGRVIAWAMLVAVVVAVAVTLIQRLIFGDANVGVTAATSVAAGWVISRRMRRTP